VKDLLHHTQGQHQRANEYDYFDLPDLLRRCTPWPVGTDLDCRFLHHPGDVDLNLFLQHEPPSMRTIEPYRTSERHVWGVTRVRDGQLHLSVMVPNLPHMVDKATRLAKRYADLVREFASHPDASLCCFEQGLVAV
jgi:hypothetical protein